MLRLATVLTAAACTAGLLVTPPPAGAAAHPHVSLRPAHTSISAHGTSVYSYRATDLREGTRIVLQSLAGTWHTLARSAPTHGSVGGSFRVDGPGEPAELTLRVAAVRDQHTDAVSGRHTVLAFGQVSLRALCAGVLHERLAAHGNACDSGSADAGHHTTFHYVMTTAESDSPTPYRAQFGAAATSCRTLALRYISDDGGPETLELHQKGSSPYSHTSSGNGVGQFTAKLAGTQFGVSVSEDDNDLYTHFNGSADCYTENGKP